MHRGRMRRILAAATVGVCFAGVAPQGCAGYLQQNLEVLLRFDAVSDTPEMYQSWIWQFLQNFR